MPTVRLIYDQKRRQNGNLMIPMCSTESEAALYAREAKHNEIKNENLNFSSELFSLKPSG